MDMRTKAPATRLTGLAGQLYATMMAQLIPEDDRAAEQARLDAALDDWTPEEWALATRARLENLLTD